MAIENLLTYTEYDPHDYITIPTAFRADFAKRYGASAGRLSYDFGAGHFAGDIQHQFEPWSDIDHVEYGYGGWTTLFMLTNILGLANSVSDAIGVCATNTPNSHTERFYLFEVYGGTVYLSAGFGTAYPGFWRYTRIKREGSTLTWTIYTDNTYDTVLTTRTLTLHGTSAYRYVQIGGGRSDGLWATMVTSRMQNLNLAPVIVTPTVTTDPATAIGSDTGTLNGNLDSDGGEACDCGFEWGETIAYGNTTPTQSRTTGQTFAQTISGLDPKKTYHFRALATNSAGTGYGIDRTFTTLAVAPTVATNPAIDINIDSATLKGELTYDGGEACNCGFEYGETEAYGTTTPTQSKVTGEAFSQPITGLDPNKTYHFRAIATNSSGTSHGVDRTFNTLASAPAVTTDAATGRSSISAAINGTLDNDIGEACECGFEWGLDTSYGTITPSESKTTGENFSQVIGGLVSNTVYHFRAFATNSFGTGYGADRTFTTALVISRAFALAREEL